MKRRDIIKQLENAGFQKIRDGDHTVFGKQGRRKIIVPNHIEINENTAKQILRDAGLI